MDLKSEEAFSGVVLFVVISIVYTLFSIEPSLDVVVFASDGYGVPVVPFEDDVTLFCELICLFFVMFCFGREEPASSGFVVKSGSPGSFCVICFALVSEDTAITVF